MARWTDIVARAAALPGVISAMSYGEPSLKVGKKLLTRWRQADNSIVLQEIDLDERDLLIEQEPEIFFLEPHYQDHPIVLVNLDQISVDRLVPYLERRWRRIALKRHLGAYGARNDN